MCVLVKPLAFIYHNSASGERENHLNQALSSWKTREAIKMDETERLIRLWSQEGHTASEIIAAQQLMQLSDEESCNNSSHGSNRSSGALKCQFKGGGQQSQTKAMPTGKTKAKAVLHWGGPAKDQSKGSDCLSRSKAMSTGKTKTKAVLNQVEALRPQKKRKCRSISEIYAETELVDVTIGDDHCQEDHE